MPLRTQKMIYRHELQANPDTLYVFGDNLLRVGYGGQAGQMRGEPNAVGVATKKAPGMRDKDFFTDDEHPENVQSIIRDFLPVLLHLQEGRDVVFPADGIGTGLSELPIRAPNTHAFIEEYVDHLRECYPAT